MFGTFPYIFGFHTMNETREQHMLLDTFTPQFFIFATFRNISIFKSTNPTTQLRWLIRRCLLICLYTCSQRSKITIDAYLCQIQCILVAKPGCWDWAQAQNILGVRMLGRCQDALVANTQYPISSAQYPYSTQYPIPNTQYPIPSTQYLVPSTQ